MRLSVLFLLVSLLSGCTHHQLRFGTVKQANTLNEVFTRQVLDNLAQFSVEPHSIPHFAVPNSGQNSVTDSGNAGGLGLDTFRTSTMFGGSRGHTESWVLEPIRDPDKLRRMQCAYQQVFKKCPNSCTDCCAVERQIYGSGNRQIHVYDITAGTPVLGSDGNQIADSLTGSPYVTELGEPLQDPRKPTGESFSYDKTTGCVSVPAHDCDGACSLGCGWVEVCHSFRPVFARRDFTGRYKGVNIWIPPQNRDKLSKLV